MSGTTAAAIHAKRASEPQFWRSEALPFIEARSIEDGREICYAKHSHETFSIGAVTGGRSVYVNRHAREWTGDLYSDHGHRDAIGASGQVPHNWAGPKKVSNGNLRVVKGNGPDWAAWHRQGREVGKGYPDVGFRCVLRITTPDAGKAGG